MTTIKKTINNILYHFHFLILISILCVLSLLVFTGTINIQYGIDNIGMIGIYSDDEAAAVRLLIGNLKNSHLNPSGFYNYGYLYHSITFYMVKLLHYLGYELTEQLVAYVFRSLSMLSYVLSLFVLYIIGIKLQISKILILLFVLLFASVVNIHFWAQTIHPDTLQILFIELAILIIVIKNNLWTIAVSSFVLGLAFGIKYSSIFLLPFLALISLHHFGIKEYKKWFLYSAGIVLIFLIAWLITNPYVYSNYHDFLEDFIYESQHVAYGHGKAESTNGTLWFSVLYRNLGLWHSIILILGLSTFILFFKNILASYSKEVKYLLIFLFAYVVLTFLYMYLMINMRRVRYLFHILPFIYLFSALGYMHIMHYFKHKNYKLLIILPILIIAIFTALSTIKNTSDVSTKGNHNYIKAYNYIADRYSKDQFILADYYSYAGKYFIKYKSVWGVSDQNIKKWEPDIIIINKLLSGRWYWKYSNTKFNDLKLYKNVSKSSADGQEQYYEFAKKIFSKSSNYEVIFELEDIVILHKKN